MDKRPQIVLSDLAVQGLLRYIQASRRLGNVAFAAAQRTFDDADLRFSNGVLEAYAVVAANGRRLVIRVVLMCYIHKIQAPQVNYRIIGLIKGSLQIIAQLTYVA